MHERVENTSVIIPVYMLSNTTAQVSLQRPRLSTPQLAGQSHFTAITRTRQKKFKVT